MPDSQLERCPLCNRPLGAHDGNWSTTGGAYRVTCDVCRKYDISSRAVSYVNDLTPDRKQLLTAIVRRHFDLTGQRETLTEDNFQTLISQAPDRNDVPSKVRYLLGYIAHKSRFPSDSIVLNSDTDYPICFAANAGEFKFYVQYANEAGFLGNTTGMDPAQRYWLKTKGWEETKRIPTLDSPYAFVAMSLSNDGGRQALLTQTFNEAIKPAIEDDAGYQKAILIDREEFLGDIVFEIIARIKECRFVVADVTDHRNGVYFEGGYAMGMGLPVIWMCHRDDLKKAHFDTSHLNHIVWDDIGELRKNLANRILATIGRGPKGKSTD
jgi:hypothetical protein